MNKNHKKTKARRQRKSQTNMGCFAQPTLFKSRMTGTMTYAAAVGVSPASSAAATVAFRLNSVYDPDYSGTGTTALGYTQMSANYGRYRVTAFKAIVEYVNLAAYPVQVIGVLSPTNTVGTNFETIAGQRHVWNRYIAASTGAGTAMKTFSGTVAQVYGVPKAQVLTEDDFAGLVGSNPNNVVYLHVGAYAPAGASGTVAITVRLTFTVSWSLPKELAA